MLRHRIGCGAEDSTQLFQPVRRGQAAEQREVQGVGLGLSLVKSVIDAHDGNVTVCSSAGAGTLVTITLPLRPADSITPAS
ncbi:ATP-binding protein [Actinoplanes sp. DH11]|uniref:ATP-binding protein n=1 Tax=Actinoplanes sp. DH11 TaxID=2857011 RepID=UPI0035B3EBAE